MKVVVHTKTGKKLTYHPMDWANELQAQQWWLRSVRNGNEAIRFGSLVMPVSNIDFVEFKST